MKRRSSFSYFLRSLIAQAVHVLLLLWPTFVISGVGNIEWTTILFTGCILLAGALESFFVQQKFEAHNATTQDQLAIRFAKIAGASLLVIFWIAQFERIVGGKTSLAIHFLGLTFVIFGIYFRVAAIRTLGAQFVSDIRLDAEVIHHGLYRYLRHPSEVGFLLIATGGPLIVGSLWTALLALLLLLPISFWRVRRENRLLYRLDRELSL